MTWQSEAAAMLAASVFRPFALAAVAWLFLRACKVRHPAAQHAVWTAVLAGMLLLPVIGATVPHWSLAVPRFLTVPVPAPAASRAPALGRPDSSPTGDASVTLALPSGSATGRERQPILWVYSAGLLALILYRMLGFALVRRVAARSRPMARRPLRESSDVVSPVTIGILRPTVILPSGWRAWTAHTRRSVLIHEFAHLRRRDAWVSLLSRLVECVFWFHPLAWWTSRRVADLAESACDAAVVAKTRDAAGYARVLLEFAAAVTGAGRRATLPGLAMASSAMGRRIDRLFQLPATPPRLSRTRPLLALLGIPIVSLAATVGFRERIAGTPQPPSTAAVRAVAAAPALVAQNRPPAAPAPARRESSPLVFLGTVTPAASVTVRPLIDGQLLSVDFREGETVKEGQLLATIDPRAYETRLDQVRARLEQDRAQLASEEAALAHKQQLFNQKLVGADEVAAATANIAGLKGKLATDNGELFNAQLRFSQTRIVAPIGGIAGFRQVDPGNVVHAGDSTVIVVIKQVQPAAVLFDLPEDYVPSVRALLAQHPGTAVEAWNRDQSTRIAVGRLAAMDNQIDPAAGTIKVKALFDNKDGALLPGQFVNIRLPLAR